MSIFARLMERMNISGIFYAMAIQSELLAPVAIFLIVPQTLPS